MFCCGALLWCAVLCAEITPSRQYAQLHATITSNTPPTNSYCRTGCRSYRHQRIRGCVPFYHARQAMYGRIEGMYTRVQLMSSLAEQKDHTLRLVGKVDELAGGLGDMEVFVLPLPQFFRLGGYFVILPRFFGWRAVVFLSPCRLESYCVLAPISAGGQGY